MRRGCIARAIAIAIAAGTAPAAAQPVGIDAGSSADAGGASAPDGGGIVIPADILDSPDAPQARAAIDGSTVQVGATFTLFITVTYTAGTEVNIPSALQLGGAFEEIRRTRGERTAADGRRVREYELELMGWFVGDQLVPPVPVTYVVGGAAHSTQTNPVPVTLVGVIGDGDATLRDIAPPVPVSRPDWTIIWVTIIVGAAVAGAALILVAAFLLRRRRRTPVPARKGVRAGPPREPGEEALARLDELEASGALDADDRKPAFIELSEIVRVYLGRRYGFPALDSTTSEIKAHLRRRPGTEAALEILEEWLRVCDLVKYAGYQPPVEEARDAAARARELVIRTPAAIEVQIAAVTPAPAQAVHVAVHVAVDPGPAASDAPPGDGAGHDQDEPDAGDTLRGIVATANPAADPSADRAMDQAAEPRGDAGA